jgi:hypothetical protein
MAFTMYAVTPSQLYAATKTTPADMVAPKPAEPEIANALNARLPEIQETDKSNLSTSEKKEQRQEVRTIKKALKVLKGGVYLSLGAFLVIILLLVLLL